MTADRLARGSRMTTAFCTTVLRTMVTIALGGFFSSPAGARPRRATPARQRVLIVQGQHNRLLAVSWSAPDRSGTAASPTMVVASSRSPSAKVELPRVEREGVPAARPAFRTVPAVVATTGGAAPAPFAPASGSEVDGGQPRRARARRAHHALGAERSGTGASAPSLSTSPDLPPSAPAEDSA